jgi:threonine dehydrogenase-like Zn-dependent dehydrogenase
MAVRNGGIVSVIGVHGGFVDKFPMGAVMKPRLTIRSGQCHVQRYTEPLPERMPSCEIDRSFVITHPSRSSRRRRATSRSGARATAARTSC